MNTGYTQRSKKVFRPGSESERSYCNSRRSDVAL